MDVSIKNLICILIHHQLITVMSRFLFVNVVNDLFFLKTEKRKIDGKYIYVIDKENNTTNTMVKL